MSAIIFYNKYGERVEILAEDKPQKFDLYSDGTNNLEVKPDA